MSLVENPGAELIDLSKLVIEVRLEEGNIRIQQVALGEAEDFLREQFEDV
jgi:hypothetical protein